MLSKLGDQNAGQQPGGLNVFLNALLSDWSAQEFQIRFGLVHSDLACIPLIPDHILRQRDERPIARSERYNKDHQRIGVMEDLLLP